MKTKKNLLFFDAETIPDPDLIDELKPVVKTGNMTDKDKIKDKENKAMSVSPVCNKIIALEMWDSKESGFVPGCTVGDEKAVLESFWEQASQTEIFIGYNILGFDLPTIVFRSMMHGIKPPRDISLKKYSYKPVFDLMMVLCNWDLSKAKKCDWYLKRLGLTAKTGDGSQVYDMWLRKEYKAITMYCRNDVLAERELYYAIEPWYQPQPIH